MRIAILILFLNVFLASATYTYYFKNDVYSLTHDLPFVAIDRSCVPRVGILLHGHTQYFNCTEKLTDQDMFLFISTYYTIPYVWDYFCPPNVHSVSQCGSLLK